MTTEQDVDFRAAASHHEELGDRQLEVLELMAGGLTNGEIADRPDGAKWNVSEVLTKLGLARRDDAAGYYRWRRSPVQRVWRHARALAFGAVGVAAAAGVVAVAGFLLWPSANGPVEPPAESYILQATYDFDASAGIVVDSFMDLPGSPTVHLDIQQWFEGPDSWVWELGLSEQLSARRAEGTELLTFNTETGEYLRMPLVMPEAWVGQRMVGASTLIARGPSATAEEFMKELESSFGSEGTLLGSAELAGTAVAVIELAGTGCARLTSVWDEAVVRDRESPMRTNEASTSAATATCGGIMRLWLREADMIVLRNEVWEAAILGERDERGPGAVGVAGPVRERSIASDTEGVKDGGDIIGPVTAGVEQFGRSDARVAVGGGVARMREGNDDKAVTGEVGRIEDRLGGVPAAAVGEDEHGEGAARGGRRAVVGFVGAVERTASGGRVPDDDFEDAGIVGGG